MLIFIARRTFLLGLMLIGLLAITFSISHLAPSDPAALAAGPDATLEMIDDIRKEYRLDQPLYVQFFIYTKGVLKGNFGKSIHTQHLVYDDIVRFFPATLQLVLLSIVFAIFLGIPLGIFSAVYKNNIIDHFIRFICVSGVAFPMFWLAMMLQLYLSSLNEFFPLGGMLNMMTDPPKSYTNILFLDSLISGNYHVFKENLYHSFLPALSLSFPALASIIRVNRAEMLETLKKDYILSAKSNGISTLKIIFIYAQKNAILPTLSMIGLRFGWMLGGTVLVETVFNWPGIGLYAFESAIESDFQPIMGATLTLGCFFMLTNFIIDLLYSYLDPRVRNQV